jgi:hypothetical protein
VREREGGATLCALTAHRNPLTPPRLDDGWKHRGQPLIRNAESDRSRAMPDNRSTRPWPLPRRLSPAVLHVDQGPLREPPRGIL